MHLFDGILGKKRAIVFSTEKEAQDFIRSQGGGVLPYKHEYRPVTVYAVTKKARVKMNRRDSK